MDRALELSRFLRSPRAVRRYAPRPIPDDILDDVLEVARWTGSSKNTQPWELIVVRDRARLRELATCGPYAAHLANAALAIVLVMADSNRRFDEGRIAQQLMLAAWAHGVGSCIGSIYPDEKTDRARALLEVPEALWFRTSIAFGYPADDQALRVSAEAASGRTRVGVPIGRKLLGEMVHWDAYGRYEP